MLSAQASLDFMLERIEALGRGTATHERATYHALIKLVQRWAEPTDQYIDDDLEMAERIGQDLAEISRHLSDLQHVYLKQLFGSAAE
jgi:hypothetical protein